MKKSISTRFKITKSGKVLRRKMGQSHFLAKKRGIQIRRKRGFNQAASNKKMIKEYSSK